MSDHVSDKSSVTKDEILLVSPMDLAYRLAYLLIDHVKNKTDPAFFQITRKGLEKLAKDSNAIQAATNDTIKNAAPISEAYIDCVRYELEKLGFALIKADKKYVLCFASKLNQLPDLTKNYEHFNTIDTPSIKSVVENTLKPLNEQTKTKDDKKIIKDKLLVLKDICTILLEQAKKVMTPETIALSYMKLTKRCQYKIHQNGLANYLYSIEVLCINNSLPKLNYLVVKETTKLPIGLESRHYGTFIGEIRRIIDAVGNNQFGNLADRIEYKEQKRAKTKSLPKETFKSL